MPERALALLAAAVLFASCGETPARAMADVPAPAADGDALFLKNCAACHGTDGKGTGPLARFLLPRPRNFVAARYRITSTLQNKPTDEDLLRTLKRGFPGTAMPSFGHLPEADLGALVAKVKSFAATPIDASLDPANPDATGPIPIPPEPADTPEGRAKGQALYVQGCAPCHGPTGRGDGQQAQLDDLGMPTWPRNFAMGEWKGGSDGKEIYRRIVGGLAGSPMPASAFAGDDAWNIVHWVRAQSDLDEKGRNEQRRLTIRAAAGGAPLDGADPAWEKAGEQWVAVMPVWMRRTPRIQGMRVAALHDGTRLSVRLRWEDATKDDSTFGQEEFRDAVAVQFAAGEDPPFFGMGGGANPGEGEPVSIQMWKADRQADAEAGGRNDLEARFPRVGADGYQADGTAGGIEVPNLPLARHDPLFLTGKAAGNGVSDLSGGCPAEDLVAKGAGTLGFAKAAAVEARGSWKDGAWTVVIRRAVPAGKGSVAFALWNGSDHDRNGIKSMTIWHDLVVEGGK